MIDLKELQSMLDEALNAETTETLNQWMDEQIALDRESGIIRGLETGTLNYHGSTAPTIECVNVAYNQVAIAETFDSSRLCDYNFVA